MIKEAPFFIGPPTPIKRHPIPLNPSKTHLNNLVPTHTLLLQLQEKSKISQSKNLEARTLKSPKKDIEIKIQIYGFYQVLQGLW